MRLSGCSAMVLNSPKWSLTIDDLQSLPARALRLYVVRSVCRVAELCATDLSSRHEIVPHFVACLERSVDQLDPELTLIHASTYDLSTVFDMADKARKVVLRSFTNIDKRLLADAATTCAQFGGFVLTGTFGRLLESPYDAASLADFRRLHAEPGISLDELGDLWPAGRPDVAHAEYEQSASRETFLSNAETRFKSDIWRAEQRLRAHSRSLKGLNLLMQEVLAAELAFSDFATAQAQQRRPEYLLHYAVTLVLAVRRVGGVLHSFHRTKSTFNTEVERAIADEYNASCSFYLPFKAVRDAIEHMYDRVANHDEANWYTLVGDELVVYSKSFVNAASDIQSGSKVCSIALNSDVLGKVLHSRDKIICAILEAYPEPREESPSP